MDLLVSLSALVQVDGVPGFLFESMKFFLRNENTGIQRKYWERQELLCSILYIVGCVVLRRPIVGALKKREISFVKESRQRGREMERERKRKLGKLP